MELRPRIKLELSQGDKIAEVLTWLILIAGWLITLLNYGQLPADIPIHFNTSGLIDGYGPKYKLFTLPIIATLLAIALTILNKYPHLFNYIHKITIYNALKQYTNATKMLRYLKLILVAIFSIIIWETVLLAKSNAKMLSMWFLPLTIALILIPILLYLVKALRRG